MSVKLTELLKQIDYEVIGNTKLSEDMEIINLVYDSRNAGANDVFVCISGEKADGHQYIQNAWRRGTRVFVVEKSDIDLVEGGIYIKVPDTRKALAYMSAAFFGYPAQKLRVIGVTGTKGKTTVTGLMAEVLRKNGRKTGTIGTLGISIDGEMIPQRNTTPESFTIHQYFDKMVKAGCEFVVMEVSSQGLSQMRVEGIEFEIAVFTNLGLDHIGPGEHASFQEYRYWKSRLFHQCRIAVLNADDTESGFMLRGVECERQFFSCKGAGTDNDRVWVADIVSENIDSGTKFRVGNDQYDMKMPGRFSVYNALAVIEVSGILKLDGEIVREVLKSACIDGRMERVKTEKNIACYIDYAHNAMSLKNVLITLRKYCSHQLIVVFGCGGERSGERRIHMGKVAGEFADKIIVTSDNPRNEDPQLIIKDILSGIGDKREKCQVEPDRAKAVKLALEMAKEGDIVLLAGKGHERYQEINGTFYYMDDRQLIRDAEKTIESR